MQKQKPAKHPCSNILQQGCFFINNTAFDKTPLVTSLGKRQDNEMNLTATMLHIIEEELQKPETGNRNVRQRLAKDRAYRLQSRPYTQCT